MARKNCVIYIRASFDEKEIIKALALENDVSVSHYMRQLGLDSKDAVHDRLWKVEQELKELKKKRGKLN